MSYRGSIKVFCLCLLGSLLSIPVLAGRADELFSAEAVVRIMPLGDSITGSPGCWRAYLWQSLQTRGLHTDFVGSLQAQQCAQQHDADNEGHGGFLVNDVAKNGTLNGWLAAAKPDVVLMHFGTNDVWSHKDPQDILAAYTTLVGQMRAQNPRIKVLVAQLLPLEPKDCHDCADAVIRFNRAVPRWAKGLTRPGSPIVVVDQWTGIDVAEDTYDGAHPSDAGNRKIAEKWEAALLPLWAIKIDR